MACVFCQILAGASPASLVWEDAQVGALMDLRQQVPGHVLVIPRQHAETLYDLGEDTAAHAMRVAHRVARAIRDALQPAGLNLWQSNGVAAGQEVRHFHLHVHPRRHGDGLVRFYPRGLPAPLACGRLDALAEQLRGHLARG